MMLHTTTLDTPSDTEYTGFPTSAALRAEHSSLLNLYEQTGRSDALLKDVEVFLERGISTGAIVRELPERRTIQGILDYWTALLYRHGHSRPVAILAQFDHRRLEGITLDESSCPYPRLVPFSEKTARFFFGRDAIVTRMLETLERHRQLAVTGPAAGGKTSLVRAGLLPALRAGALQGSTSWECIIFTPGVAPLQDLVQLCRPGLGGQDLAEEVQRIGQSTGRLHELLRQRAPVVLFVDQLEELYVRGVDDDQNAQCDVVVACLEQLVRAADADCKVVVAARVDDGTEFEHYSRVLLKEDARIDVPVMGSRELNDAIVQPADQVGLRFEDTVVVELVRSLLGVPSPLPLLQFVLLALWDEREGNVITRKAFNDLLWDPDRRRPNAALAIATRAEHVYASLAPADRHIADQLLVELVQPGVGWEFTLKSLRRSDLRITAGDPTALDRVLGALALARLLRATKLDTEPSPRIELTHAALVRYWPHLIEALDKRRYEQRERVRLKTVADQWFERAFDSDLLLSGQVLEEAQRYHDLTPRELRFVNASLVSERAKLRRRRLLWSAGILALSSIAVLSIVAAALLFRLAGVSAAHQLAADARLQAADRPDIAARLALRASTLDDNRDTRASLLTVAEGHPGLVSVLEGTNTNAITALATSANRGLIAAGHRNGTVTVWQNGIARQLTIEPVDGDPNGITSLAFDAQEATLAVASEDARVALWDTSSWTAHPVPDAVRPLLTEPVGSIAFSSDGKMAFAANQTIVLWGPAMQPRLLGHTQTITGLAFSPDGKRLASGAGTCEGVDKQQRCTRGEIKLWDGATGQAIDDPALTAVLTGPVRGVAFSRAGVLGFTNGADVVLWNVDQHQRIGQAADPGASPSRTQFVNGVAFNSDGTLLAAAGCGQQDDTGQCLQGEIALLSVGDGSSIEPSVRGLTRSVQQVAFVGDTPRLASTDSDTVSIWDTNIPAREPRSVPIDKNTGASALEGVWATATSSDRQVIASSECGTFDGSCTLGKIRVWDVASGATTEREPLGEQFPTARSLAFANDGVLASGLADGEILIWDLVARTARVLQPGVSDAGKASPVTALAVSADGQLLAAGGSRGDVTIYAVATARRVSVGPGASGGISVVALSPDKAVLAVGRCRAFSHRGGCREGEITLWDAATGRAMGAPLSGHVGSIASLGFSADGRLLASGSDDRQVILWDVEGGRQVATLRGHPDAITGLSFSANGSTLAASDQATLLSWPLGLNAIEERVCRIAPNRLSPDTWEDVLADTNGLTRFLQDLLGVKADVCANVSTR